MVTDCLFNTLFILIATTVFIELTDGVSMPVNISKDMAKLICRQRTRFSKRGVLEEPIRFRYRPPSPLRCGWYSFGNCDKDKGRCAYQKYDDCAVYVNKKLVLPKIRIHGGQQAIPHSHPSVLYMTAKNETHIGSCGAVAIDPNYALTAAHCTAGRYEQDITLEAGRHNLKDREMITKQVIQGVYKIYEHPTFNVSDWRSPGDICVIELYEDDAFKMTEYVYFAGIVGPDYSATGEATLAGWGNRDDGSRGERLQKADMTIISDFSCRKVYGRSVTSKNICTYDKGVSGCDGDSGAPLYQFNVYGEQRVIGIEIASGRNCSRTNKPTIFTEVSHYSSWIGGYTQRKRAVIGKSPQ